MQVVDHVLGAIPPVDFAGIALALVDVADRLGRRRLPRLGAGVPSWVTTSCPSFGFFPRPIVDCAARGLDAGADAVLIRTFDAALLLAQVRRPRPAFGMRQRLAARATKPAYWVNI